MDVKVDSEDPKAEPKEDKKDSDDLKPAPKEEKMNSADLKPSDETEIKTDELEKSGAINLLII